MKLDIPQWLQTLILPSDDPSIASTLILIFMVMFLGSLLGKIKIKKVSLGISGIVFSGIFLGHIGYRIEPNAYEFLRDFGLILFVYAIGMQVGPAFFTRLKNDGILYNGLAIGTVFLGGLTTLAIFYFSESSIDNMVGIMSGAVTNTPGLGAAKVALNDLHKHYPEKIFTDPTNAYAVTYPFGVLGIILLMIVLGKVFKINIHKEIKLFQEEIQRKHPAPDSAKCRVTNENYIGQTLGQFLKTNGLNLIVTRIKHSGSNLVESPEDEYVLQTRDVLMLVGLPSELEKAIELLGYQSTDTFIEAQEQTQSKTFYVSKSESVQKTIGQLNLSAQYHVKVSRVFRSGITLLAHPDLVLHYGDRVRVVGSENNLKQIEKLLGNSEKKLQEPQLLSIFVGIILGILVGSIPFIMPGLSVPVKLGMAAGPLLIAIVISRFGGIKSLHSFLQQSAMQFMKDFGISLFFAAIGIHAGESFYHTFITYHGWVWVAYGLLITFIPIICMILVARFVFKLNFLPILGLISGAYTDPAALDFSISYYRSEFPLQAYATVYPLVTIMRIVVAQLLVLYFAL
jgi:putative transport protein